ncbi:nuclear transport factor 2 family protein [Opitutus sp. GAS368]|uniref:nuclear transport factor 2 family protein n=1 Tax=Opitutus sp. GAS368 TaxID=1882749 RepID=UPI00087BBD31|nr:nuclear transport factor 2 family protein [Opitutus sp. GAS368]SDR73575.1 protein of unknown function [Opitutus sp. GAS368]
MKSPLLACLVLLSALSARAADAGAPVANVYIMELLTDFLTHNSDPARHEKFWADEIVYTSAMGVVRTKTDIMKNVHEAAAKPVAAGAKPGPVYSAEDINIRPYNGFAALTFRLVARNPDGTTDYYRNSGTLIFRDGRWQVITWQATKIPPAEKK